MGWYLGFVKRENAEAEALLALLKQSNVKT